MDFRDDEIIRRVQAGEAELFHVIFERHYARIEMFVRRSVPNRDERRDLVAEVFVRALESVRQFDATSGTPYVAYLYAIARNLIVDHLRSPAQRRECVEAEDDRSDSAPAALEQMLRRESIERVRCALSKLPPDHQQIIHLAFEDDLSGADIARIMDKPSVSAVTSHLYRAMQALRKVLQADSYFDELPTKEGEDRVRTRKSG